MTTRSKRLADIDRRVVEHVRRAGEARLQDMPDKVGASKTTLAKVLEQLVDDGKLVVARRHKNSVFYGLPWDCEGEFSKPLNINARWPSVWHFAAQTPY